MFLSVSQMQLARRLRSRCVPRPCHALGTRKDRRGAGVLRRSPRSMSMSAISRLPAHARAARQPWLPSGPIRILQAHRCKSASRCSALIPRGVGALDVGAAAPLPPLKTDRPLEIVRLSCSGSCHQERCTARDHPAPQLHHDLRQIGQERFGIRKVARL